jgi:predicted RNA-binding Zn ribbon-like protein
VELPWWVWEGERKPAPMPLLLVQAFVNTWEADAGRDLLSDPETAGAWLGQAGLWEGETPPRWDDLRFARQVRESIRALLVHNGGGPSAATSSLRPLELLAGSGRARIDIGADGEIGLAADAAAGGRAALLHLLLVIRDAQIDGTWPRLKVCHNEACRWAFYDRSHTRQGRWCDMAVCGNRIKNRNLRQRRR